jgi:hypothetical protein
VRLVEKGKSMTRNSLVKGTLPFQPLSMEITFSFLDSLHLKRHFPSDGEFSRGLLSSRGSCMKEGT